MSMRIRISFSKRKKLQKNKNKPDSSIELSGIFILSDLADVLQHFAVGSHGVLQILHNIGLHR